MHLTTPILLSAFTLFPAAYSLPSVWSVSSAAGAAIDAADGNKPFTDGSVGSDPDIKAPVCSATTSHAAVPAYAQDPAWKNSMLGCLQQLNNANWNGYECIPNNGDGSVIGVPFGFYKGNKDFSKTEANLDGNACYSQCQSCLTNGINALQAVTTSCTWDAGSGANCWMGFNYGG